MQLVPFGYPRLLHSSTNDDGIAKKKPRITLSRASISPDFLAFGCGCMAVYLVLRDKGLVCNE
jgi:hypothetical protein